MKKVFIFNVEDMKRLKNFLFGLAAMAMAVVALPSCLDSDNDPASADGSYSLDNVWLAIATVVPQGGDVFYLRLDDGTTLWPAATNYPDYRPQADQRAFVSFTILSDSLQGFSHYIKLNGIHDILTKPIAPDLGARNDSIYGTDPVAVGDLWVGDGYLNCYFAVKQGGQQTHFINLIQPDAAADPYTLEFRHHAMGDPALATGWGRAAFNLSSLPDTGGETVDLRVLVRTFDGNYAYTLKYNTDKTALYATGDGADSGLASNANDFGTSNSFE